MLERIAVISTLRVEDSHGMWQLLIRIMMVAYDEVYAKTLGIVNHVVSLNAAVEYDDELHAGVVGIVNAFLAHAIALVITVRDIIVYIRIELL